MGVRDERVEDLFLEPLAGDPTEEGQVRNTGADIVAFIDGSVKSLTTGSGLDAAQHRALDQLTHALDETHEQVPVFNADGVITSVVAQGVGGGTVIRDVDQLVVDADGLVTGARIRQRDAAGVVVETLTAVTTISGGLPTKATVTRSP